MKKFAICAAVGFVLTVIFSFTGFVSNCNSIEEKVVRLHVLGNSNSEYDQEIKIKVKDAVFQLAAKITQSASSRDEAYTLLNDNIDRLEDVANTVLEENNINYGAKAEMTESFFNTRDYDNFSLPAGNYESLRISLGSAQGRNWWCAVYPGLCLSGSADYGDLSNEEKDIITHKDEYRVTFKVYEIYCNIVNLFKGE